jgi:ubiquinone biosynthesis protein UbiJ
MTKRSIVAIESLLNQHIQESSTAQDRLFALAGRSLAINIQNFGTNLRLDAEQTRLGVSMISDDSIVATTATISGTPLTLLNLLNVSTLADFRAAGVEFSGDIQTAEAFAELLRLARPDLEEELSHLVGDIVAHKMARSVRRVKGWGTRANYHRESRLKALAERSNVFGRILTGQLNGWISFSREPTAGQHGTAQTSLKAACYSANANPVRSRRDCLGDAFISSCWLGF